MQIYWATHPDVIFGLGAGYTLSNLRMREALVAIGVELGETANVAVHLCHPDLLHPIPGKRNVLLTMTEHHPIQSAFRASFWKVDLVLAPSTFVERIFHRAARKAGVKLLVSRLGYNPVVFPFTERSWQPGQPFHWLWCGAPNARKGWPVLVNTWAKLFMNEAWLDLTLKTTVSEGEGEVITRGNVTYDSRAYSDNELASLYSKAHGFVLPTQGEGFGLTPLEALGTGLPVISTGYGGQLDFLSGETAWLIDYVMDQTVNSHGQSGNVACANVATTGSLMLEVMRDYPKALAKAKIGCDRVAREFTWESAAIELVENIKKQNWVGVD